MSTWLALLLLACVQRGDPELERVRQALEAWEDGVAAMEGGDSEGARIAFQDARRHQPDDPLLVAWEARATAAGGDLVAAVELLDLSLIHI